jgi:hypothetical protein
MASGLIVSTSATLWSAGCGSDQSVTGPGGGSGGRDAGGVSSSGSVSNGSSASGTASSGVSSSGSAGGGGPGTPNCKNDPTTDPTVIDQACGLFVRGDATDTDAPGAGTPDKPFKTIQAAIEAVNPALDQSIFVCTKNVFTESVTIAKDNVAIYGGFDCASPKWVWKGDTKSTIAGTADKIVMTVSGQGGKVENFNMQAATATKASGASIAVLVNAANPSFIRCDMSAAQGKAGADGTDFGPAPAPAGLNGSTGGQACSKDTVPGATQVANTCSATDISIGGSGGQGTPFNGNPGSAGQPSYGAGQAGQGEPSNSTTWSCAANGGNGKDGAPGAAGVVGSGATGVQSVGSLSVNGFTPVSGKDGTSGQPGQGGGGGGGVKGGAACSVATKGGASGGSGGSGGCGGQAGKGGKGAGASIALVSLASPGMTLTNVTLKAATGVNGGAGGDAQAAGAGAPGGAGGTSGGVFGLKDGCAGGAGGKGGDGGPGGGGRGGHSIGLAYTGVAPTIDAQAITVGNAGKGGLGGNSDLLNNKGEDGKAAKILGF